MVNRSPWQFGDRKSPNQNIVADTSQFPKLIVEHPQSRLGDPNDINVRGTSRQSIRDQFTRRSLRSNHADVNLPTIPDGVEVKVADDRSKPHMPIFGRNSGLSERISSRLSHIGEETSTIRQISTQELEQWLRQKVKNGYFSLKNLFLSYDPDYSKVNRETLLRILSTFMLMKISISQFNRLMKRLDLEHCKTISFDKLYAALKQEKKPEKGDEYPSWFHATKQEEEYLTANHAHMMLKQECEDESSFLEKFNLHENARLVKPMLFSILEELGFKMKLNEMEKLWYKYDSHNEGVIQVKQLIDILKNRVRLTESRSSNNSHNQSSDRDQSINIEKWLSKKFREGIRDMYYAFKEFEEYESVTRDEFLKVLHDYGLFLKAEKLDSFLERCNVECGHRILYKDFLNMFQDRSSNGMTDKILTNPHHKYNQMNFEDNRRIKTGVSSIEAKLIDIFQKEYLSLLNKFLKIDKDETGLIGQLQFRAVLESYLGSNINDRVFHTMMKTVPKVNDKIKYFQFMETFDNNPTRSIFDTMSSVGDNMGEYRSIKKESSNPPTTGAINRRSVDEITFLIKNTLQRSPVDVDERFFELDVKNTRRMNVETMRKLLKRLGLDITQKESEDVWKTIITDHNGKLEYLHFIRHFVYSRKSAAYPNSKTNPPIHGDADYRLCSLRFNSWKDLVRDYAKAGLENNREYMVKNFKMLDENDTGYVSEDEFKFVLRKLSVKIDLTSHEIDIITDKIALGNKVDWKTFLQHIQKPGSTNRSRNTMNDIMNPLHT